MFIAYFGVSRLDASLFFTSVKLSWQGKRRGAATLSDLVKFCPFKFEDPITRGIVANRVRRTIFSDKKSDLSRVSCKDDEKKKKKIGKENLTGFERFNEATVNVRSFSHLHN